ncbi:hypothetical protein [Streptomyces sp. SPB162]|uniref:hypothetical protein n=1 Tax=Streptomyces sp. SPB162 TaxID=2940560 RepID=UPI002404D36C|nr:hypothetical protein [Streptomyces sp. SPB162]MDF9811475.1 hypothetical protein [Streptomyces sp. SPB162]
MSVFGHVGAGAFGLVIGWIAYRTLRRSQGSGLSDLVTVIAALGGGAVVDARFADPELFASYGLGLATGFFGYFVTAAWFDIRDRSALLAERAAGSAQPGATSAPADSAGSAASAEASLPPQTSSWQGSGEQDQPSHRRIRKPFEQ